MTTRWLLAVIVAVMSTLPVDAAVRKRVNVDGDGSPRKRVVAEGGSGSPTVAPTLPVSTGGNNGLEAPSCRSLGDDNLPRIPNTRNAGNVYLHSGEYYLEQVDLRIRGRGFDFVWKRNYRSREGRHTAMGWNWDHSYNLRLQVSGDDPAQFWVYDGSGRRDTYMLSSNGCWIAQGLFNELCADSDGTYLLTFPNGTQWRFIALAAGPAAGLVQTITDRNLNMMTFAYDTAGQLVTVTDTLGRPITIAYSLDGHIVSLTDFIGRQVTYAYYQAGDTGGAAGDLKSWTTPGVVGTPNGNDFPAGKTVTYTYSQGQAQTALNHNLIEVKDALGNVIVRNSYTSVIDPTQRAFDRLERQVFFDGTIFYFYVAETPAAGNGMATTRTIVRDRALNVREAFFNALNQMVVMREYTGRSPEADIPTTDTLNRPGEPLRPGDPPYFETRGTCNSDSLRNGIVYACGDEVQIQYEQDLNSFANRREQGNVRYRFRYPGPRGGDQGQIQESFYHLPGFGSCCGDNFVTYQFDGRGNAMYHYYDSRGNRTHSQYPVSGVYEDFEHDSYGRLTAYVHPDNGNNSRRRDEYVYGSTPSSHLAAVTEPAYLTEVHVDALGRNLITRVDRDAVGNITRVVNPRNQDTLYTVNALDQVVRTRSREVTLGSNVRYPRDTFYDANDAIVRVDVQNLDGNGVIQPNAAFSTSYTYDLLGRVTSVRQEVDPTHDVVRTIAYEPNGQACEVSEGESTAGRQIANKTRTLYDERDLMYRETRAPDSPGSSTTQYDYDCGANIIRATAGIEGPARVFGYTYDGYDRLIGASDPMGNMNQYHYDAGHNAVSMRFDGQLVDVGGPGGNVRLSSITQSYDPMNRPTRRDVEHFDLETQASIGDGMSTTLYEYNAASLPTRVTDDNGRVTETRYDSLLEVSETIDAKGNRVAYNYDDNQNVSSVIRTERSDMGGADQVFRTDYAYDGLDRLKTVADSSGSTTSRLHDSRNNLVRLEDALRSPSPGGPGNVTTFVYDGLNRQISRTQTLTSTGTGGGPIVGSIVTTQAWDDSSRLLQECDGNGRCTGYTYDASNQVIRIDYADGTSELHEFNVHGNPVRDVDANGTIVTSTYDSMDGLLQRTITLAAGVDGATTFENYQYDGMSQLVRAVNNQSVVTRAYDSLSNVIRETINGLTLTSTFDGEGNAIEEHYPGGTTLFTTFDELNRKSTISRSAGMIASYSYDGPGRVRRRDYGNGTRTEYQYDGIVGIQNPSGDFGVQQITRATASSIASGAPFDDWSFSWDRVGSKVRRTNLLQSTPGQLRTRNYAYDSAYRLQRTTALDVIGSTLFVANYTLDAAGNRTSVSGPEAGAYVRSGSLPDPGDDQMNQYTSTPFDTREYDDNGNLAAAQATGAPVPREIRYDYANRPVRFIDSNTGIDVRFVYDAFGRRIEKYVGGAPTPSARYAYREAQEIEETDALGATRIVFVHGNQADELLMMRKAGADYFYHADDQGTVTALTNAAGAVVERYSYGDFGKPVTVSALGNPYLFEGRRYDAELGLYYYRARYLDPTVGRFITRDPLGVWGDPTNSGNPFAYVGNNPASLEDPTGMLVPDYDTSCDGKTSGIDRALMRAETLARNAYYHMAKDSGIARVCDMRYLTWFGWYKHSRYSTVESGFASIRGLAGGSDKITISCSDTRCKDDYDALVDDQSFPGARPDYLALCNGFFHMNTNWILKTSGLVAGGFQDLDAQGGVLVHEYSHLRAHTDDDNERYGIHFCQMRARTDPSRAIRTAQNYQYFSLSPIEGTCSLGQLFTSVVVNAARELVGATGRFALRAEKKAASFAKRAAEKVSSFAKRAKKKWRWH
jgi:RHS repeat-associated protein